jgi:agmatinase
MPRYQPTNSAVSPRFSGIRTFGRLPHVIDLTDVDVAVMGVPFDTSVTNRVGARYGPPAIREQSIMTRTYNPTMKINVYNYISAVDYGDLPIVPGYIHETYAQIEEALKPVLDAGVVPILLGGDHGITLAHLRAVAKKYGPVGLIQFDSHNDLWDQYWGVKYTHGTPFRRAIDEGLIDTSRSSQVGLRGSVYEPGDIEMGRGFGFQVFTMDEVWEFGFNHVLQKVKERAGEGPCFLTFDIDFIDPAYAPATGTPEVGGPTTAQALQCIRALDGVNFVGFDVVEVLPTYEGPGQITALAAANVAYEMLTLVALDRRRKAEA